MWTVERILKPILGLPMKDGGLSDRVQQYIGVDDHV
jgi:hypothetical protein